MILALEAERSPTINVTEDRFILPQLRICEFCHTNSALSVIGSIKEFLLPLFLDIDVFRLQVSIQVESKSFKGLNKLSLT